ncbi:MAG TPA: ATP-binding protein [Lacisediminihabitans sp.]|nr:ATP-binding protein [Lacisediminihabitans sp.]HXD61367.1 ATP-binding protein [Lacisediminihabitans sp.]
MSLGIPAHLAPQALSRAFARGQHAVALTCLAGSLLVVLVFQWSDFDAVLWPAALALVPVVFLLWLNDRSRTSFSSASYLIVGGAGVYWYAITFSSQTMPILEVDAFSTTLPKIALIMVGGSGAGLLAGVLWATAGYLIAEFAVGVAILQSGRPLGFDPMTFLTLVATLAILVLVDVGRRSSWRTQPRLHRAARDEQIDALRYRIEAKAAALMHDTLLSHLAAIANSDPGPLHASLQSQMERDLEILIGEEWLSEGSAAVDAKARTDWRASGLYAAIQESRLMGLEVESTGDLAAVARLDQESSVALGLAVKQCLVNVLKHSGTTQAEVAVYGSESDVSVMVVDTGKGFMEAETGADRLGLRNSVRRRIEAIEGTVQVWSTPGRGTSIMIRVPVDVASEVSEEPA